MARANLSSIDTTEGDKIALYGKRELASQKEAPNKTKNEHKEQIVNARKKDHLDKIKAKKRKKAKMAKASRKKNKK